MSFIDDLSSDSEDEFPPGFLTANLTDARGDADFSDDDSALTAETGEVEVEVYKPRPPVEFQRVSYKERQFAKKMRARVAARNYYRPPDVAEGATGLARSGFTTLSLNVSATTTVVDLTGQALGDAPLSGLWALLSESPVQLGVVPAFDPVQVSSILCPRLDPVERRE